ncbi:MAG: Rod shape-determining protein MreD [Cyclobacteriaceae bacterium]|nr:MAG: Rod shape-determining protein MreD [Cyclobacteriaceae bacterium]
MSRSGIFQFVLFIVYLLVQVLILRNLVLFNTAFCFLYIAFVLLLPIETNNLILMLVGFLMGFMVDIFYDSMGLHALATVLVAYLRNYWLGTITPQGGYESGATATLAANGVQWFLVYALPLVFTSCGFVFVEASGFTMFWYTMLKIVASLLFTMSVIVMLQFLTPQRRRI